MSCWELTMLERRNRLRFDRGSSAWIRQALGRERTVLLPVTVDVAIRGGTLQTRIPIRPTASYMQPLSSMERRWSPATPACWSTIRIASSGSG